MSLLAGFLGFLHLDVLILVWIWTNHKQFNRIDKRCDELCTVITEFAQRMGVSRP